ncbi:FecR family protein [Chryseobacterium ureilyticum]|uniref:FecR family protein n=1 Tax=Chryseobacterium ureilyticum TaxID=373668 RepID=A0A1N7QQ68_9FLAO|nr:FecR family protein [Chryseobacterium ureilyticum]SIT25055.1 FecR family protein [Chryseobacterium ureilyticum]
MSLEKEFEETWKTVSKQKNKIDKITDQRIWENINKRIRKKKNARKFYWVAATVIPFFILLIMYNSFQNNIISQENKYVYESLQTSKKIQLSDGSVIKLMPYSKLILDKHFGEKNREINFTGQADFNITKDQTKPFRINAGNFHVVVLGTHFFLDQKSEEKKVELFEGKVKIEHLGKITYLLPKEIWMNTSTNSNYHYYKQDKQMSFTFDRLEYSEAVKKLEETYNVKIFYPDQYKDRLVTGSLKGNLNDILSIISFPFNLKIEKHDSEKIILK